MLNVNFGLRLGLGMGLGQRLGQGQRLAQGQALALELGLVHFLKFQLIVFSFSNLLWHLEARTEQYSN